MTPERQLFMAEDVAKRIAKRLELARTDEPGRARHMEVARDMLRVLTERIDEIK